MDSKKINSYELKKDLLRVYETFVKNPLDKSNLKEIEKLSDYYTNATEILEKPLSSAIWILEDLRVYGKGSGMNDSQILESSRKILEELRKS
jgi:hypothetical protein